MNYLANNDQESMNYWWWCSHLCWVCETRSGPWTGLPAIIIVDLISE